MRNVTYYMIGKSENVCLGVRYTAIEDPGYS